MKRKLLVFMLFIVPLIFHSCKKNNEGQLNSLSYMGQEYPITRAYLFSTGRHPDYTETFVYELVFVSSTINIGIDSNNTVNLSGKGNYLNITLLYRDSTGMQSGRYYSYLENNRKISHVDGGFNFDTDISVGLKIILEEDNYGELNIEEENNEYLFDFYMISAAEKLMTGNFRGKVEHLN